MSDAPHYPTQRWHAAASYVPLGLVLLLALTVQAFYLVKNTVPLHWDPSIHTLHSMRVAKAVAESPLDGLFGALWWDYTYYPPGYYLTTAPAFLLFGHHVAAGLVWQIPYLLLTLVLIAKLVERYATSLWGAVAALGYACLPAVLGLDRMAYIENLQALEVVLFAFLLLRPGASFYSAVALGVVAGWGQLTKWGFAGYVGPLAVAVVVTRLLEASTPNERKRYAAWVGIAAFCFAALALPWHLLHWDQIARDLHQNAYVHVQGNAPSSEPSSVVYYLQSLPWQLVGLPIALVLYTALVGTLAHRLRCPDVFLIAVALAVSLVIFSIPTHKQGRFIVPLLPLWCVVLGVFLFWAKRVRRVALPVLVGFGGVNCTTQTFELSAHVPEVSVPIGFQRKGFVIRYGTPEWILPPLSGEDWRLQTLFAEIAERAKREGVTPSVAWCLDADSPYYNTYTLGLYSGVEGLELQTSRRNANYWVCRLTQIPFYRAGETEHGRRPEELGRWTLPDGSEVRSYRAVPDEHVRLPLYLRFNADDRFFEGFLPAQSTLRRSARSTPRIQLPFPELAQLADAYRIGIALVAATDAQAEIRFNGEPAWRGRLSTEPLRYAFTVPRERMHRDGVNQIELRLPKGVAIGLLDVAIFNEADCSRKF